MTDEIPTMISTPTGDIDASKTEVPTRTFRGAWRLEGDVINVDMDAARDIARDKIRQARTPLLVALDVEYMRATEIGTDVAPIVTQKQFLRDATADPRIDEAQTPEDLEAALDGVIMGMSV